MNDAIIKVEGLGKKYIIAHEGRESYTALRDVISRKAKKLAGRKKTHTTKEEFWALKDVNFEIKQGEAVGIIGRNGAGKSTLLKILSRITEPTTGRIELNGRVASLLEVGTGFHPELTGRENIFLNGAILGMGRAEIRKKFDEIVEFSGVEKFLDTPVKRYSSGMYVRLAFSVAAHLEPEILVVDEVLAVGDAEFQKKCLGKMNDVSKSEGRTVLFVSHNLASIKLLCNKCMFLSNGKLELIGESFTVINHYLSTYRELGISSIYNKNNLANTDIELVSAEVLDSLNCRRTVFEITESITVKLKLVCQKIIPNLCLYIVVKNDQEDVFMEFDSNDDPTDSLDKIELGINFLQFDISNNILPVGRYIIYLNFSSLYSNNFNIETPGDILNFEIVDTITRRGINRKASTSFFSKIHKI